MKPKAGQLLKVKVEDDLLTLSIGVGLLAHAIQAADASGWPEDFKIHDPVQFAREIARCLEAEEEDGTTPVHRMLDAAAIEALENGADGCIEGDVQDGLKTARLMIGDGPLDDDGDEE